MCSTLIPADRRECSAHQSMCARDHTAPRPRTSLLAICDELAARRPHYLFLYYGTFALPTFARGLPVGFFSSLAQLTGSLFLDFLGNSNSMFVFQIGTTLTTASGSSVSGVNGLLGSGVYWQVGSSATLGTTTSFMGSIIADQSVTLTTNASIACGRAIALVGAVTMDTNVISTDCTNSQIPSVTATPEPATLALFAPGLLAMFGVVRRHRA